MEDLLAEFVAEASATLSQLDEAVLAFQRSPADPAT